MFVCTLRTEVAVFTLRDGGRGKERERQSLITAPLACSLSEQREHIVKTTFTNPASLKLKTQMLLVKEWKVKK